MQSFIHYPAQWFQSYRLFRCIDAFKVKQAKCLGFWLSQHLSDRCDIARKKWVCSAVRINLWNYFQFPISKYFSQFKLFIILDLQVAKNSVSKDKLKTSKLQYFINMKKTHHEKKKKNGRIFLLHNKREWNFLHLKKKKKENSNINKKKRQNVKTKKKKDQKFWTQKIWGKKNSTVQ